MPLPVGALGWGLAKVERPAAGKDQCSKCVNENNCELRFDHFAAPRLARQYEEGGVIALPWHMRCILLLRLSSAIPGARRLSTAGT